jgi:hypothetical protein
MVMLTPSEILRLGCPSLDVKVVSHLISSNTDIRGSNHCQLLPKYHAVEWEKYMKIIGWNNSSTYQVCLDQT